MRRHRFSRMILGGALAAAAAAGVTFAPARSVAQVDGPPAASEGPSARSRTTWLLGQARVGRRKWVTGAAVLATPVGGGSRAWVTSTDVKGAYRFEDLPEGAYRVSIVKPGYVPIVKDDVELRFPFRAVLEVIMEPGAPAVTAAVAAAPPDGTPSPTARLGGTVVSRDGQPVEEVRIRLVRADGSVDPRDAVTDADGRFEIPDVRAGTWRAEVLGAGYLPIRVPLTVTGESTLRAVVVPQPAGYEPQPVDLMPPEVPIPPPG